MFSFYFLFQKVHRGYIENNIYEVSIALAICESWIEILLPKH
jgi:hypothetical protein